MSKFKEGLEKGKDYTVDNKTILRILQDLDDL